MPVQPPEISYFDRYFGRVSFRQEVFTDHGYTRPRRIMRTLKCLLSALVTMAAYGATQPVKSCESLMKVTLPVTAIHTAEVITNGSFTLPEGKAIDHLPPFCRVAGIIRPSSDSNI